MAVVALLAGGGGYFLAKNLVPAYGPGVSEIVPGPAAVAPRPADLVGTRRPDFTLNTAGGETVSARDFDGRVWLLNFWATWCAPCVEEMPMLSRLQRDYAGQGFEIVGVALDDPDRAREFADEMALDYPILVGRADVVLTGRQYGNTTGMLPFSVLIDAAGVIRWSHLGAVSRQEIEKQIQSLR